MYYCTTVLLPRTCRSVATAICSKSAAGSTLSARARDVLGDFSPGAGDPAAADAAAAAAADAAAEAEADAEVEAAAAGSASPRKPRSDWRWSCEQSTCAVGPWRGGCECVRCSEAGAWWLSSVSVAAEHRRADGLHPPPCPTVGPRLQPHLHQPTVPYLTLPNTTQPTSPTAPA